MKETLHIKNFGPIIDTNIEIKDINIFIGTTSSSKSTMAKLIAIFKSGQMVLLPDWINGSTESQNNYNIQFNKLLAHYNIEFVIKKDPFIRYTCDDLFYEIRFGYIGTNYTPANKEGVFNPIYIPAERIFFSDFFSVCI